MGVAAVWGATAAVVLAAGLATAGLASAGLTSTSADAGTPTPLTCAQLVTPELEALATEYFAELRPLEEQYGFPGADKELFLERGGQFCTWFTTGPMHAAYSPITEADAAVQMARLDAAGLVRSESTDGISYELPSVEWFTVPEVSGHYLFANGYWYLVRDTTSGSGGTTAMPTDLGVLASLRALVEGTLGASPALETDQGDVEDDAGADADDAGTPETPETPGLPGLPTAVAGAPFTATDPSVLSTLPTAADVADPRHLATGAGVALVFTALVALPTALLNNALQTGYERLRARMRRILRRRAAPPDRAPRLPDRVVIAVGLVGAAAISTLVDPRAGFNGGTLRLFASSLGGLLVESLALLALLAWLLRRRGAPARVRFHLGSLLILILAVLATRLTGFEPGFLFGVVLAIVFARPPAADEERIAGRLELWLLGALALAAWVVYSILYPAPQDVLATFVLELLASLTIGGITALMILLAPVGDAPGAALFRANRLRWTLAFLASVVLFCVVLLPLPESWEELDAPFVLWLVLFVLYALLAIAVWALVTFRRVRQP